MLYVGARAHLGPHPNSGGSSWHACTGATSASRDDGEPGPNQRFRELSRMRTRAGERRGRKQMRSAPLSAQSVHVENERRSPGGWFQSRIQAQRAWLARARISVHSSDSGGRWSARCVPWLPWPVRTRGGRSGAGSVKGRAEDVMRHVCMGPYSAHGRGTEADHERAGADGGRQLREEERHVVRADRGWIGARLQALHRVHRRLRRASLGCGWAASAQ